MGKDRKKDGVFHVIAPIYGMFYNYQKRHYNAVLDKTQSVLDISKYENIIDIGCGTGALCSVLSQRGLKVTGVDSVQRMLNIAAKKRENKGIKFIRANALERMPFTDKSFDVSIASYVAHGLEERERKAMYAEMSRITKNVVIISDYNKKGSTIISIVEWFEGGDYFNFRKKAETEMKENFRSSRVMDVGLREAWYIGTPKD